MALVVDLVSFFCFFYCSWILLCLATMSLCKRVAYETLNEYGTDIAYQIRFDTTKASSMCYEYCMFSLSFFVFELCHTNWGARHFGLFSEFFLIPFL